MLRNALLCAAVLLAGFGNAYAQSPYAGQESREIKALSPQEISDLLAGKGMGLAKAAELNGYPGPMHVLELAAPLQLTPEQTSKTKALFKKVNARAVDIGRQLVEEERALDGEFASKSITPTSLQSSLERIATLQAELRRAHLEAHLEQTALLSDTQIAAYSKLRGYGAGGDHSSHGRRPH
jgi:LTXXQ motif family protein